jgi:metal-sulfur cluster biosynthetic enzyme
MECHFRKHISHIVVDALNRYTNIAQVKESQVIDILKQCYDPELPVELWNLGLIYNIQIQESYDGENSDVNIVMSLTTPGCIMGQYMMDDMKMKLTTIENIGKIDIELTFDPPWNPEMITEDGKVKLGLQ